MILKTTGILLMLTLVFGASMAVAGELPVGKNEPEQKALDFVSAF